MTKSDYQAIAAAIRRAEATCDNKEQLVGVAAVTADLIRALEADNPRFRRGQFLAAALATSAHEFAEAELHAIEVAATWAVAQ